MINNLKMEGKDVVKCVIEYLQNHGYKYLYFLHSAHFGNVIAALDPDGREVAVKICKIENICIIEDKYWKTLKHPHLLEVYQIFTIEELGVRIYVMPHLTTNLYDVLHSENFRQNNNSFQRIKKWLFQVLCGLEHLHSQGLCHLNIRIGNIFIDDKDNAVIADFSDLNFKTAPVDR